jgi:hypothetical protein
MSKNQKRIVKHKIQSSSGDLVEVQISVTYKKRKGLIVTRDLLNELIRHKAATSRGVWRNNRVEGAFEGEQPPGFSIKIIRWRNPDRLASEDSGWRSGDQAEAWGSLRRVISVI